MNVSRRIPTLGSSLAPPRPCSEVPRSQVSLSQLVTKDGRLPEDRKSSADVRVGDRISVCVDSLYSPYGDMQVRMMTLLH